MAFAWLDTKEVRDSDAVAYAILNDTSGSVSRSVDKALASYGVRSIRWSAREETARSLAN